MDSENKKIERIYILRFILRILQVLSLVVLGLYVLICIGSGFFGFEFFGTSYGMDAIFGAFMIYGFIFWPLLLACAVIAVGSFIYFKMTKGKYEPSEAKENYKAIFKKLRIIIIIILLIFVLVVIVDFILSRTYFGAKVKYSFSKKTNAYDIIRLDDKFDESRVDIILANEVPVYVNITDQELQNDPEMSGLIKSYRELEPFKKVYYSASVSYEKVTKYVDFSKATHYIVYDHDRIELYDFYYYNGYVANNRFEDYILLRPLGE